MRRPRTALVAVVGGVALAAAVAVGVLWTSGRPDPYAGLRQAATQEIPGTFGYTLSAVPSGFRPSIDPVRAYGQLLGSGADRHVALTLADVTNVTDGVHWGPAWVYLTRDLCYFTAKGDFVSPARSGGTDGCTADNLLVQVVDARTGAFVAAFDAYDIGGDWLPQRQGGTVQAPAGTRFH